MYNNDTAKGTLRLELQQEPRRATYSRRNDQSQETTPRQIAEIDRGQRLTYKRKKFMGSVNVLDFVSLTHNGCENEDPNEVTHDCKEVPEEGREKITIRKVHSLDSKRQRIPAVGLLSTPEFTSSCF